MADIETRPDGHHTGHTLNRRGYDRIAAQWDGIRQRLTERETVLLGRTLDGIAPPATVLDAGCGTGMPMAGALIERGFSVIGVDQSAAMLAIARRRFPQQQWHEGALETTDFAAFGAVAAALCWDCLFHIQRQCHPLILGAIHTALRPGGRLMLTCGGSEHPAFTDTMFEVPFFYDSWTPAQTEQLLRDLGYRICHAEYLNVPTDGRDKGRYAIVAEKP